MLSELILYLQSSLFSICIVIKTWQDTFVSIWQTSTIIVKNVFTADWNAFESLITFDETVVIITNGFCFTNSIFTGWILNLFSNSEKICSNPTVFQFSGVFICHKTEYSSSSICITTSISEKMIAIYICCEFKKNIYLF